MSFSLTLYRQRFSLRKNAFFTAKAVFEVLWCQMPLNFATKAFSYILAQFWASFCWKLYIILVSRMRVSENLDLFFFFFFFFFFADSFLIFSRFFCFPFSLPFFSLYLLPFVTFLSTGKVLASVLLKTWKWNIDQLGDLAYFTTNFAAKIGHVFLV